MLSELLARNADLFATLEAREAAYTLLIAGTVDDPDSFNETGGKTGALGYYPILNVNGQTMYFPCQARLKAIALGGANAETLDALVAQVSDKLVTVDEAVTQADAAASNAAAKASLADEKATLAGQKAADAQAVVDAGAGILSSVPVVQAAKAVTETARDQAVAASNDVVDRVGNMRVVPFVSTQYSNMIVDEANNILALVERVTGRWKMALTPDSLVPSADDALAKAATALGLASGASTQATALTNQLGGLQMLLYENPTYSHIIVDAANNALAYIERATGRWKMALTPDSIIPGALSSAISSANIDERASGWLFPILDADGNILGGWRADGTFVAALSPLSRFPAGFGVDGVLSALAAGNMAIVSGRLFFLGDSLTAGAGGGGVNYPQTMATLLGLPWINTAVGGTQSGSIGVRGGGIAMNLTLASDLPADGSEVDVVAYSQEFSNNQSAQSWTGTFGGIPVILRRYSSPSPNEATTLKYTMRRQNASSGSTAIPAGTRFFADLFKANEKDTFYIQAGRNDPKTTRAQRIVLRDNILSMIDHFAHDRFGILPVANGAGEGKGTAGYDYIMDANRLILEAVGDHHFCDHRRYLASNDAQADAGLTPDATSAAQIASDTIPDNLRSDSIHGIGTYYQLTGQFAARFHRGRGWATGI
ncbi:hypothetical protein AWL63_19000 [Sphingomonas panacis]|uniref:Uncharacterized protein n=2 Tax=Sphingomonas panacis TaxID=1560345 RepID=A0A1B3ZE56_9SPHN|nr:hypothetical protein AWL63_19000 [Sphingomonas panacis]